VTTALQTGYEDVLSHTCTEAGSSQLENAMADPTATTKTPPAIAAVTQPVVKSAATAAKTRSGRVIRERGR
jgi:hypothetical protein